LKPGEKEHTLNRTLMKNKKIVIAGGTGFIGQALTEYFGRTNSIVILSRLSGDTHTNLYHQKLLTVDDGYLVRYVKWDGKTVEENWSEEIAGADIVINLAGKSVNCRYHKKQKQEIFDSRVNATNALGEAIRKTSHPPALWVNAASATIYQNSLTAPNDEFTGVISDRKEDNMPYNIIDNLRYRKNRLLAALFQGKESEVYKNLEMDFSVKVCKLWEKVFFEQETHGTRKVALRTAITLGKAGVITPYLNLCKFGLCGKQGSGKQMFSWVHVEDVARMIQWLYENEKAIGVYNCVAPNAVSNYSLLKSLRQLTGNKIGLPAGSWMLEAGAFLIGTETELLLKSRWVIPTRATREGFVFNYPLLRNALEQIIADLPRRNYSLL
jgi:NAD dependent epimerase/dehydratase family enzyme